MKKDIDCLDDVQLLVHSFYTKVQDDTLIGPVFAEKVSDWEAHLPKMVHFWSSILLGTADYHGQTFEKHRQLDIDATHFDRWLTLFKATVDESFEGPKAEEAKSRAGSIGKIFSIKLDMLRKEE